MNFSVFAEELRKNPIIAAIREIEKVDLALKFPVKFLFLLAGDITNIKYIVSRIKKADRFVFIHIDLMEGIGRDYAAIRFLASEVKPHGVITTRSNLIRSAKKEGLCVIQRIFVLDSLALETGIETVYQTNPDAVEVLPGTLPSVIKALKTRIRQPIISGGLIKKRKEIQENLEAGAVGISTSSTKVWESLI